MARRVNTRFLGLLGAGVLGAVILVIAAEKLLIREHPDQYIAAAKLAEASHNYAEAVVDWQKAWGLSRNDPALPTALGNAYAVLAVDDATVDAKALDRISWEHALEINPDYVPAVKALVHYWQKRVLISPSPDAFRFARERAELLHKLAPNDPEDRQVQAFSYDLIIDEGISGFETDQARLADAEKQIARLQKEDPSNAQLPYHLALLALQRGKEAKGSQDNGVQNAKATEQFARADQIMNEAVASQAQNAPMHYYAASIDDQLADADRSAPENRQKYRDASQKQIDQAIALLKPSEPTYVDVSLEAARLENKQGNTARAQELVGNLMKESGGDADVAVRAAPLVGNMPTIRATVENALRGRLDAGKASSLSTDRRQLLMTRAMTDLEIMDFAEAAAAQRGAIADQIKRNLTALDQSHRDGPGVARLSARFAMAGADFVGAIQVLNKAIVSEPAVGNDVECMWMLAQSYAHVNQNVPAIDWCNRTITREPQFLPARKLLVEVLSHDGSEQGRIELVHQIEEMARIAPSDPEVQRWQMLVMRPSDDAAPSQALYAKLPEDTEADIRAKAALAAVKLKDVGEAERLFNKVIAINPHEPGDYISLAQLYGEKDKPKAIEALGRGVAANPADQQLAYRLAAAKGASQEDLARLAAQQRSNVSDPVSRELLAAENARQQNKADEQEKHLKLAEAADGASLPVANALYSFYVQQGKSELALPYLAKLKAGNADQAHGLLIQFSFDRSRGDAAKMMDDAKVLVATLPEFAQSYLSMGLALMAQGNYPQAIDNFDIAIQKKSDLFDARLEKIQCNYQLGHLDAARQAIDDAVRSFPNSQQFHTLQIEHQLAYGDPNQAVTWLEADVLKDPNNATATLELAQGQEKVAQRRRDAGDADGADVASGKARDGLKDGIKRFPDDARFYGALANNLVQSGDRAGSVAVLLAFDTRPAWNARPEPQLMLASLYGQTNQPDKALSAFRTAFFRSNSDAGIEVNFANYLAELHQYDKALALLDSANTDNSAVVRQRIAVLIMAQQYDAAETAISKALQVSPQDASDLHAQLAEVDANRGQNDKAMDQLNQALAINGHNGAALFLRGRLRSNQSPPDVQGAINDLTAAHDANVGSVPILNALADAYLLNFDSVQAASALEAALRTEPGNLAVRLRLAQVYATGQPAKPDAALKVLEDGKALPGMDQSADIEDREALVYLQKNEVDRALEVVSAARLRFANDPRLGRTYFLLLAMTRQFDKILAETQPMISATPAPWWVWNARGQAHAESGDKTTAAADFNSALAEADGVKDIQAQQAVVGNIARSIGFDPAIAIVKDRKGADDSWEFTLIRMYHLKGDDAAAMAELDPLMANLDTLSVAQQINRLVLGGSIYASARPKPLVDKAFACYTRLLKRSPNDVAALNNLACLCADGFAPSRVQEGLGYINKALDLLTLQGTNDPLLYDTQGWLLVQSGEVDKGMETLRKALQRRNFPEVHYHLAEGYVRLNRAKDAQREINLSLQAVSDDQQHQIEVDPQVVPRLDALSARVVRMQAGG